MMGDRLTAYVVADTGADFTCEIANLSPRSLFLSTDQALAFQEKVSVTFFSVEVRGEVALASRVPRGLLVVFDAPPAIRRRIEAHMQKLLDEEFDEAPATEIMQYELELVHGLTSHAAARAASTVVPPTVQARRQAKRREQDTDLDPIPAR